MSNKDFHCEKITNWTLP